MLEILWPLVQFQGRRNYVSLDFNPTTPCHECGAGQAAVQLLMLQLTCRAMCRAASEMYSNNNIFIFDPRVVQSVYFLDSDVWPAKNAHSNVLNASRFCKKLAVVNPALEKRCHKYTFYRNVQPGSLISSAPNTDHSSELWLVPPSPVPILLCPIKGLSLLIIDLPNVLIVTKNCLSPFNR